MLVIGLCGGAGTGKSHISNYLQREHHAHVIIGDVLGYELLAKGGEAYASVIDYFGKDILEEDGTINRQKLGKIVFTDSKQLNQLNALTHPKMYQRIKAIIKELDQKGETPLVVIDAAVLIEAHFTDLVDYTWFVCCELQMRIDRLVQLRHFTREKALQIINGQQSDAYFAAYADAVIDNSKDFSETVCQMEEMLNKIWRK